MKRHHKYKAPETIRKGSGMRIVGQNPSNKESVEDTSMSSAFNQVSLLRLYYQVGKVYAFDVFSCHSFQKADGTQHTKYILQDRRGEKHTYECDCTCFQGKKEVCLRIKEISGGRLKFESSIVERLEEIFLKGEEYKFEVISCTKNRCVVCDVQIGKNHQLIIDDGQCYESRKKLQLKVQGYDDNGNLLLVDPNPPTPKEPCINSFQIMAEAMAKSSKRKTSHVTPKQKPPKSARHHANQSNLSDTPKVSPSIAIPREDRRVLVEDLGYKMPAKAEKYVTKSSETMPVYTRSITQSQVKPKHAAQPSPEPEHQPKTQPAPEPQPKAQPAPEPEPQPKAQPEPEHELQPIAQPTPEPELQPKALPSPEPELQPTAQPSPELEPQPTAQPSPEPEPQPTAQPSPELEPQPAAQPNPEPEPQPTAQPDPEPEPQPKAQPDPESESQPTAQPAPEPELQPIAQPAPEPEPQHTAQPESEPEPLPILLPEPQTCKSFALYPFLAWMDGVCGMEKTEDYTVYSGHAGEVVTTELPAYKLKTVCVAEAKEIHTQAKPWYVRVWQLINRYFSRN